MAHDNMTMCMFMLILMAQAAVRLKRNLTIQPIHREPVGSMQAVQAVVMAVASEISLHEQGMNMVVAAAAAVMVVAASSVLLKVAVTVAKMMVGESVNAFTVSMLTIMHVMNKLASWAGVNNNGGYYWCEQFHGLGSNKG